MKFYIDRPSSSSLILHMFESLICVPESCLFVDIFSYWSLLPRNVTLFLGLARANLQNVSSKRTEYVGRGCNQR